jgi:signal transduction histidine kinase
MGLLGIEERVSHLGGSVTVDSTPGSGTSIEVVLPLRQPAAPPVEETA